MWGSLEGNAKPLNMLSMKITCCFRIEIDRSATWLKRREHFWFTHFAEGRTSVFIDEEALQDCEKKCQQNSTGFCLKPWERQVPDKPSPQDELLNAACMKKRLPDLLLSSGWKIEVSVCCWLLHLQNSRNQLTFISSKNNCWICPEWWRLNYNIY